MHVCVALVAQLVERSPRLRSVVGSNPTQSSFFLGVYICLALFIMYMYMCVYIHLIFVCAAHKVSELDKQKEEEAKILHSIKEASALMSVSELAKGVVYTEPLVTG